MPGKDFVSNLPTELLQLILVECSARDILNFSLAAGKVSQFAKTVRNVSFEDDYFVTDEDVKKFLARFGSYAQHFSVRHCSWLKADCLKGVASLCPNLKSFDSTECRVGSSLLCAILAKCHHLEVLSVTGLLSSLLPQPLPPATAEGLSRLTGLAMLVVGMGMHCDAASVASNFVKWLQRNCSGNDVRLTSLRLVFDFLNDKSSNGRLAPLSTAQSSRSPVGAADITALLPGLQCLDIRILRHGPGTKKSFDIVALHGSASGMKEKGMPRNIGFLRFAASHSSAHLHDLRHWEAGKAAQNVRSATELRPESWCRLDALQFLDLSGCIPAGEVLADLYGQAFDRLSSLRHLRLNGWFIRLPGFMQKVSRCCSQLQSLSFCRAHVELMALGSLDLVALVLNSCGTSLQALDMNGLCCCAAFQCQPEQTIGDLLVRLTGLRYLGLPGCCLVPYRSLGGMTPLAAVCRAVPQLEALEVRAADITSGHGFIDCDSLTKSGSTVSEAARSVEYQRPRCKARTASTTLDGIASLKSVRTLIVNGVPSNEANFFFSGSFFLNGVKVFDKLEMLSLSFMRCRAALPLRDAVKSLHHLRDLRLEQTEMPSFGLLVDSLTLCARLQRICLVFSYTTFTLRDLQRLLDQCQSLVVLQLFTSEGTLSLFKSIEKEIMTRYATARPSLSVSIVLTGKPFDVSDTEVKLRRVPLKHYIELTSCEPKLMDIFERECSVQGNP